MEQNKEKKKFFENTAFGHARRDLSLLYQKHKRLVITLILITNILVYSFIGYYYQYILIHRKIIIRKTLLLSPLFGIRYAPILGFLLVILFLIIEYRFYCMIYKDGILDEELNRTVSDENLYGSARKMSDEEKDLTFHSGDFDTQKGNILGCEPGNKKKLYSLKRGYGMNGNVYIVGSPGAGKSRCIAISTIMQTILREESMIISDPKGELYGKVALMAKAHGYDVKLFDVHPKRMLHSDTVDFMNIIGDDSIMAQAFASTIIQNLIPGDETKPDFWTDSELNELTFIALYVANNDEGRPKTLGEVYKIMNENSVDELEYMFDILPETHPAKPAYNTWSQGDKVVKGNTHAGLQIHLQKLSTLKVQRITGRKEIDFTKPLTEKCLYFVSMSDQDKSFSFLIALFFTLMCQEQVGYYDMHGGKKENGKTLNHITLLLDEFYSIGKIPDFDVRLSNMRSRGIDAIIITQSLGQLKTMYPDELWEAVLDCCTTWILLRTNSLSTAEYFSKRSGDQTVLDKSKRYNESEGELLKLHPEVMIGETHGKGVAMTPHQIMTMDANRLLVVISGHNVVELEKVDYSEHPMCKEIREIIAARHKPAWIEELTSDERERLHVDDEIFDEAYPFDEIELCTKEDFKEHWNDKKQKELESLIAWQINKNTKDNVSSDNTKKHKEVLNIPRPKRKNRYSSVCSAVDESKIKPSQNFMNCDPSHSLEPPMPYDFPAENILGDIPFLELETNTSETKPNSDTEKDRITFNKTDSPKNTKPQFDSGQKIGLFQK